MDNFSIFPQLLYLTVVPSQGTDIQTQLNNCIDQLKNYQLKYGFKKQDVIKQTIFIKALDNNTFYHIKEAIVNWTKSFFPFPVPTTVVAQTPENKVILSMEVAVLKEHNNIKITRKEFNETDYVVLNFSSSKLLISGGQSFHSDTTDILLQSQKCFETMSGILEAEGFEYSDVIRQWNYIEKITGYTDKNGCQNQHYQVFNDVRSMYYKKSNFKNGYPAATGIGTYSGGVIIDFFALKSEQQTKIQPIKNPVQVDAHKYSEEVLDTNKLLEQHIKTTPKFERAKLILTSKNATLYISGTAAIKGEHTIPVNDAAVQTRVTLENIQILSGDENLINYGLSTDYIKKYFSLLRIYVKNEADIPTVKSIIDELHPDCPCKIIQSEVCRANLLVEIEGVMEFEW